MTNLDKLRRLIQENIKKSQLGKSSEITQIIDELEVLVDENKRLKKSLHKMARYINGINSEYDN